MSETRISPLGLFQFSPTKRRHLSRFKNYIFDPRGDTLFFGLLNRRREKHRGGGKFSATRWISSAIRGSRSAVSRNEVTRPEPSLSVNRVPAAAFPPVLYLPISRDALYAEKQAYTRGEDDAPYPECRIFDLLCVVRVVAYVRKYVTRGTYLSTESSSSAAAESLKVSLYLASGIVARAG